jgi:hypothetical protein
MEGTTSSISFCSYKIWTFPVGAWSCKALVWLIDHFLAQESLITSSVLRALHSLHWYFVVRFRSTREHFSHDLSCVAAPTKLASAALAGALFNLFFFLAFLCALDFVVALGFFSLSLSGVSGAL